jgi:hypothetical protein
MNADTATLVTSTPTTEFPSKPDSEQGGSEAVRHSEGAVARSIEEQTARLPSDTFLWAAFAAIGLSMALQASGTKHGSLFVGQWVAPFMLFGVYNKLVKVAGSDRLSR